MAQGLAIAPVLLLIPHAATDTPPPQVTIVLFPIAACDSATPVEIDGISVDTSPELRDLPNNQCEQTPNKKVPGLPFVSFKTLLSTSAPAGTTCFTTVFSDDACANNVVTVPTDKVNGALCSEAVPPSLNSVTVGIKSAKAFCAI